jgi:hypothetical protein
MIIDSITIKILILFSSDLQRIENAFSAKNVVTFCKFEELKSTENILKSAST